MSKSGDATQAKTFLGEFQKEACDIVERLLAVNRGIESSLVYGEDVFEGRYNDRERLRLLVKMGVDIKKCGIEEIDDTRKEEDEKYERSLGPESDEE